MKVVSTVSKSNGKRCVIVFVKAPKEGMVKSRLAAFLGEKTARALYRCFVEDIIATLNRGAHPVIIYFSPARALAEIKSWLGVKRRYVPQTGDDLGQRMRNAFLEMFSTGIDSVILVGSDIPDITKELLEEAFDSLDDHDVVIGPAHDGGYYLIGFNRGFFLPDVFEEIEWSTPHVFAETTRRLIKRGLRVRVLDRKRDIDTVDDLAAYYRDGIKSGLKGSVTMGYLDSHRGDLSQVRGFSQGVTRGHELKDRVIRATPVSGKEGG
ncbi:MAG TPA: TIGR04282 family arsenosugar biosynthesis glycosyltransferase [Syntrophorhabdaceae bacterium]|nr:TIGR04282 family arsenosugar biosynthesis glycosyltransferase [Syntrophorhabdaceae bacterium]